MASNSLEERYLSKVYNKKEKKLSEIEDSWLSPKTILLASAIGCTDCGEKLAISSEELWYGENNHWADGLCPECKHKYPLEFEWSLPIKLRTNSPNVSYNVCQFCRRDTYDYAIWGLCEECYLEWQDSYIDPTKLYSFVDEYGALAALLIRPNIMWINYLKQTLEHKYCYSPAKRSFPENAELIPFTLEDGKPINIKELVNDSI